MNGRIYDAEIGRFLSADPIVQSPYLTNSFNRYSYVMNNPLKYTDPTGYRTFSEWASDTWESIKSAFSGSGSSGNGNGNDSSDNNHDNLEGEGLSYTIGYIGRAIGGLFGGAGNTQHDQLKMAALTARTQCESGRCGSSQLSRIRSWNAHVNLMYSAGAYAASYIGGRSAHIGSMPSSITRGSIINISAIDLNSRSIWQPVFDEHGMQVFTYKPQRNWVSIPELPGVAAGKVSKWLSNTSFFDVQVFLESRRQYAVMRRYEWFEKYDTTTNKILAGSVTDMMPTNDYDFLPTGRRTENTPIDIRGCVITCSVDLFKRGVLGEEK